MSLLSDGEIKSEVHHKNIGIEPFCEDHINPASYDLTLAAEIRSPLIAAPGLVMPPLDVRKIEQGYTESVTMNENGVLLNPGDFILATSEEYVRLPKNLAARAEGKSSLGRIGLMVHVTAGYIDPGFEGQVTLEIYNCLPRPIVLRAGMRIAQLAFFRMSRVPIKAYGATGHYMHQRGPTESRFRMDND